MHNGPSGFFKQHPTRLILALVLAANALLAVVNVSRPGSAPGQASAPAPGALPVPEARARLEVLPQRVVAPQPPAATPVSLRLPAPECRAWGPYPAVDEAEALAGRLGVPNSNFEVYESTRELPPEYLVTLPAPAVRREAERLVAELAGHGVESYLMARREEGYVLAAGVFSTAQRARSQQQRLAELEFSATVESLPRFDRVYHLMARVPAGFQAEIPAVGRCGDIAPLEQFL